MTSRLQECIQNREHYIAQLCTMRDTTLARKIDLIQQQIEMAHEQKNDEALELLLEWERQVIAARLKKQDEKIADALSDIELEVVGENTNNGGRAVTPLEDSIEIEVMQRLSDERKKALTHVEPAGENTMQGHEENTDTEPEKPRDEQLKLF